MSTPDAQSLPVWLLNLVTAVTCAGVLVSCGDQEEAAGTETEPAAPAVSDAALDAEISKALTPAPAQASAPVAIEPADELADWVDDIRRRHPNKGAVALLNVPEVNEKLVEALKELSQNPKLRSQIDSTVDVAAAFIGLDGPPGSYRLDLKMDNYTSERTDRMLEAVLTGRAEPVVDFVVGEIGEAAPDLSYGSAQRAPNGVAIGVNPQPAADP